MSDENRSIDLPFSNLTLTEVRYDEIEHVKVNTVGDPENRVLTDFVVSQCLTRPVMRKKYVALKIPFQKKEGIFSKKDLKLA